MTACNNSSATMPGRIAQDFMASAPPKSGERGKAGLADDGATILISCASYFKGGIFCRRGKAPGMPYHPW